MAGNAGRRNAKTYEVMVAEAVDSSNSQKGLSVQAISKYLRDNFGISSVANNHLKRGLEAAVRNGKIVRLTGAGLTGSFRLPKKKIKSPLDSAQNPTKARQQKQQKPGAVVGNSKNIPPPPPKRNPTPAEVIKSGPRRAMCQNPNVTTQVNVNDLSVAAESLEILSPENDSENEGLETELSRSQGGTGTSDGEDTEDAAGEEPNPIAPTEEEETEDTSVMIVSEYSGSSLDLGNSIHQEENEASGADADDELEETNRWHCESQFPLVYYRTISSVIETVDSDDEVEAA